MRAAREGLPGVPDPVDGRIDRDPSGANAAAADPCQRHADQRSGAGAGQVVQPLARIRLPDLRGGYAGYFRADGSTAPIRDDRAGPRPVRAGAVRARLEGDDGCRNPAGNRLAGPIVALIARPFHASVTLAPKMAPSSPADGLVFATILGLGSNYQMRAFSYGKPDSTSRKMLQRNPPGLR